MPVLCLHDWRRPDLSGLTVPAADAAGIGGDMLWTALCTGIRYYEGP